MWVFKPNCKLLLFLLAALAVALSFPGASAYECWDADGTNETWCEVDLLTIYGLNCIWNADMLWCDPNWDKMTCADFCGACVDEQNCTNVSVGGNPNCLWDSTFNFCYEDFGEWFYGADCDATCYDCFDNISCVNSAAGCKWFADPADPTLGWCDYDWVADCSEDCSMCWTEADCLGTGPNCTWDYEFGYCYEVGKESDEVCFNAFDDDGDFLADCEDPDCAWDPFCGGASVCWQHDFTNQSTCEGETAEICVWDSATSLCDPAGTTCWKMDGNQTGCENTFPYNETCNFQAENQFCRINETELLACEAWTNQSACEEAGCTWFVEEFPEENVTVEWCAHNLTRCFGFNETECTGPEGAALNCIWTADPFTGEGFCDPPCFNWTLNQTTCEAISGCEWLAGLCKPKMFMEECPMYRDNASCEGAEGCDWIPGIQLCDFNFTLADSCIGLDEATCNATANCVWREDPFMPGLYTCEFELFECFDKNETECTGNCTWNLDFQVCEPICFQYFNDSASCENASITYGLCEFVSGICEPEFASLMFKEMDPGPPLIIGFDPATDTEVPGKEWLDIVGFGIKDMPDNYGLGIGLFDISQAAQCNFMYFGTQTAKYYYYLDTDNNVTTGCASKDGRYSGFEYELVYITSYTDKIKEDKLAYRCVNGSWVFAKIELIANKEIGCGMSGPGFNGVAILGVDKAGIGNPLGDIRFYVATADEFTNDSAPIDYSDEMWYTPGAVDFEPIDCFADPMACGSAFAFIGGGEFMPFEDCINGVDDDLDGYVDCEDEDCWMFPPCQAQYNCSTDKSFPKVTMSSVEVFDDFAVVFWNTDELTNGSVLFYGNYSDCTVPVENVYDSFDDPYFEFDDYKMWHDVLIENLTANTTYHYKIVSCDRACPAAHCTISKCLNFTTTATKPTFKFDLDFVPPAGLAPEDPLGYLEFFLDFDKSGVFEADEVFNYTEFTVQDLNYSTDIDMLIKNPNATKGWELGFAGVDVYRAKDINLTGDLIAENGTIPGAELMLGIDHEEWLNLGQSLGIDYVELTFPQSCSALFRCNDTGGDCVDVSQLCNKTFSNESLCIWTCPATLGFSVYQVNCTPSWSCTQWGDCQPDGTQECVGSWVDANNCGQTYTGPTERSCVYTAPAPIVGVPPSIARATFAQITPLLPAIMDIDVTNIAWTQIKIEVKNIVSNVVIEVETLATRPAEIPSDPPGTLYQYTNITTENIEDADIESVEIQFSVEKTWLSDNELDKATIALFRYSAGEWTKLVTEIVDEDEVLVYLKARAPGLSVFAITASALVCSAEHPELCATEAECVAAGLYWYDDACHTEEKVVEEVVIPDTDADGIPDAEDRCPTQAGPEVYGGCPQACDNNGVCEPEYGENATNCPADCPEEVPPKPKIPATAIISAFIVISIPIVLSYYFFVYKKK